MEGKEGGGGRRNEGWRGRKEGGRGRGKEEGRRRKWWRGEKGGGRRREGGRRVVRGVENEERRVFQGMLLTLHGSLEAGKRCIQHHVVTTGLGLCEVVEFSGRTTVQHHLQLSKTHTHTYIKDRVGARDCM